MAKRVVIHGRKTTICTSLALLFFMLLVMMANLDDHPFCGANFKRRKLLGFSATEKSSREISSNNGVQIGRRGGKHHHFSWRDNYVFNASAHEVPSGPNPISNR
ncbi:OLC1v1025529C1 [Oldenlandia corymbosa var. corymbosa]|uniref:OLC1v1025529C1 n=1 Tax=Oldenlandia corymbosa var. corymbosa TaxID=529605 RepID=A0AAV1C513_OLDCO|nr:OLC1v1025529C1 [Oldenlandia corymbosa var. corymbosa]